MYNIFTTTMYFCICCWSRFTTAESFIKKIDNNCNKSDIGLCYQCATIERGLKICRTCFETFTSRNKLFKHLKHKPLHQLDGNELIKQRHGFISKNKLGWATIGIIVIVGFFLAKIHRK